MLIAHTRSPTMHDVEGVDKPADFPPIAQPSPQEVKKEPEPSVPPFLISHSDISGNKGQMGDIAEFGKSVGASSRIQLIDASATPGSKSALSVTGYSGAQTHKKIGGKSPLRRSAFDKPKYNT